jgi:hypothetical protein
MARRTRLQQARERAGAARRRQERVNGEQTRQREADEAKRRLEALREAQGARLERQVEHADAKLDGMKRPPR